MAFNPSKDLNAIQKILIEDEVILELMDLTGSAMDKRIQEYKVKFPNNYPPDETIERIVKGDSIIKRSKWDDLVGSEKRLCIYFIPDRSMRNESFLNSTIEVNIHTPALHDFKAWQVLARVNELLHKKKINNRYLYLYGQIGELSTMQGFFCCGARFNFSRLI